MKKKPPASKQERLAKLTEFYDLVNRKLSPEELKAKIKEIMSR